MADPDDTTRIEPKRSVPTVHYTEKQLQLVLERVGTTTPKHAESSPGIDNLSLVNMSQG